MQYKPVLAGWLVFLIVFSLSAFYMARELNRGWVPHDEGTLGQSAERILQGEMPHRDFDEIYTGGLSYLNAVAFRVFGTRLSSLRYMLYLFFLAWLPAVYYIATRFVSAPVAGVVTLLAVAWGPPNYAAAMPSWYNLFFASFGLASVLRYVEVRRQRWLFVAGLCGGVSFLFKISGAFFVAGVLLFFLIPESNKGERPASAGERNLYRLLLLVAVSSYSAVLLAFIRRGLTTISFVYFVLPELAVGAAIIWLEFTSRESGPKTKILLRRVALFGGGAAVPILTFMTPYLASGALPRFFYGVFVLPGKRYVFESLTQTRSGFFSGLGVDLVIIAVIFLPGPRARRAVGALVVTLSGFALILVHYESPAYRLLWMSVWSLPLVIVALGLKTLVRQWTSGQLETNWGQQVFLVLSVMAACNLIQFPFSAAIYFCYVAPLLLLAATAVLSQLQRPPRLALTGLAIFFLSYAILEVTPGFIYKMGIAYGPNTQTVNLTLPRGRSLRVEYGDEQDYSGLVATISEHARGRYLYCSPDCPEVDFLSGYRNPSRTIFDFFDDSKGRTSRILALLEEDHVNLVVINSRPGFSGQMPIDLRAALDRKFPDHAVISKFEVRWRP